MNSNGARFYNAPAAEITTVAGRAKRWHHGYDVFVSDHANFLSPPIKLPGDAGVPSVGSHAYMTLQLAQGNVLLSGYGWNEAQKHLAGMGLEAIINRIKDSDVILTAFKGLHGLFRTLTPDQIQHIDVPDNDDNRAPIRCIGRFQRFVAPHRLGHRKSSPIRQRP